MSDYLEYYLIIVASSLLAIIYSVIFAIVIIKSSSGSSKMQEIAQAIAIGAKAYLKRQYIAIALVGIVLAVCLQIFLNWQCTVGFIVGAVLSSVAGFLGMHISIRANVRTT